MNYFRLMLVPTLEVEELQFRGVLVTKMPIFVKTENQLDAQSLYADGIMVKQYESLPTADAYGKRLQVEVLGEAA